MASWPQFVRRAGAGLWLAALLCAMAPARGDTPPSQPVGRVEGNDISVESGTPAGQATARIAPSIYVSNGGVVVVHSGHARMTLFAGGKLDICGPAKFTVLLSGNSITLALNFGRLHVQLPPQTSLRIFTPTIVATPLDISGGARDVTVGLSLDDSLCVLPSSGALQLEHQFTGEKLIVPQAGEFFLSAGRLVPTAGAPGSCQCSAPSPRSLPPPEEIPQFARAVPPPVSPAAASPAAAPHAVYAPAPGMVVRMPLRVNDEHPLTSLPRRQVEDAPPDLPPVSVKFEPALLFMASAPPPPRGAMEEILLLVRAARISPDWEFNGHVDAPDFAAAMRRALGEGPSPQAEVGSSASQPPAEPKKKRGGFWAALKDIFAGS